MSIRITINGMEIMVSEDAKLDLTDLKNIKITVPDILELKCPRTEMELPSRSHRGVLHKVSFHDGMYWCDCEHFFPNQDDAAERDNCWHIKRLKTTGCRQENIKTENPHTRCPRCGTPMVTA